jgi:hypothetical protein
VPTAGPAVDLDATAVRLLVDLAAIAVLAVLAFHRQGRRDLVVLYATFNAGLFVAVVVIAAGGVSAAVGFGLFAVLSIIRLRSEALGNPEIAGFFAALVLALACAVDLGDPLVNAALCAILLAVAYVVDHPRLVRHDQRVELTLERVVADPVELEGVVRERLGSPVQAVQVLEVDYVRELTRVSARITRRSAPVGPRQEEDDALAVASA